MNFNNPYYNNPYVQQLNPYMQQQIPQVQRPQEQYPQQIQPSYNRPLSLQGKSVDSIDVVKATDIPLDGTISYFPLTDGSAIVSKQLLMDGTSKTVIYKPVEDEPKKEKTINYITEEQLEQRLKKVTTTDYKDDIKSIKRELKDLKEDFEDIKSRKD